MARFMTNAMPSVMPTYRRADDAFERGEGAYLFDTQGRRYLDFMAGVAVSALGHCHLALVHARTDQAGAGGQEKLFAGFGPLMPGFDRMPFGDADAAQAAIGPETAGILIEPVQGEGGVLPASPDYLRRLRALADAHGLLLFLGEVQTGIGRTGHLFAYQAAEIEPDVLAAAKGLGAGFPVAACLATARVGRVLTPGTHGSTLGGNPLAMRVAATVLDQVLAPGFLEQVRVIGDRLRQALAGWSLGIPPCSARSGALD